MSSLKEQLLDTRMRWFIQLKQNPRLRERWGNLKKQMFENDNLDLLIDELRDARFHDGCVTLIDIDDDGVASFVDTAPKYGRDLASVVIFALAADAPNRHILQYLLTIGGLDRILIQHLENASFSISPYWLQERVIGVLSSCIQIEEGVYDVGPGAAGQTVYLNSFEIGTYPVTQAFYETLVKDNPSLYDGLARPVDGVTWFESAQFCNALSKHLGLEEVYRVHPHGVAWRPNRNGYRLPTELEWEVAARANQGFDYAGSDRAEEVACFSAQPYQRESTDPVGMRRANGFNLYDMSGNVFEWCWDRFSAFPDQFPDNYSGPKQGKTRVRRGGAWNSTPQACSLAHRSDRRPASRGNNTGFRVARTLY